MSYLKRIQIWYGQKKIIQVKDSIPWVRCASGNVYRVDFLTKILFCDAMLQGSGRAVCLEMLYLFTTRSTALFGVYYSLRKGGPPLVVRCRGKRPLFKLLQSLSRIQKIMWFAVDRHPPSQMCRWSLECRHMYADVSLPLDNVQRVRGVKKSHIGDIWQQTRDAKTIWIAQMQIWPQKIAPTTHIIICKNNINKNLKILLGWPKS